LGVQDVFAIERPVPSLVSVDQPDCATEKMPYHMVVRLSFPTKVEALSPSPRRPLTMFAVAASFLARSNIGSNYTIHDPTRPSPFPNVSSPAFGRAASSSGGGSSGGGGNQASLDVRPVQIGLWRVVRAENKTTKKVCGSSLVVLIRGRGRTQRTQRSCLVADSLRIASFSPLDV
jgi:hypothetical protein